MLRLSQFFFLFLKNKAIHLERSKQHQGLVWNTMKKNIPILLLSLFLVQACQYFGQVPDKDELLKKELSQINWNQVDEYPSFASCDSLTEKTLKKQCFFDSLTHLIQEKLNSDTLSVLYPQLDTIKVKVTISADASMAFEPQISDTLSYNTVQIDSILNSRLVDFPKVNPAIKRGVPVKTQFVVPVILNVAGKE